MNDHTMRSPKDVVSEHLEAFADRDLERVLATFADDATFSTADGTIVGRRALRQLFAESFALPVEVEMQQRVMHVSGDTVACELAEAITAQGVTHTLDVAGFYTVRDGRLVRVRVYRDVAS